MIKKVKYIGIDITQLYYETKYNNSELFIDKGYDIHKFNNEIEVAKLLVNTFGGELRVLKVNEYGGKNPDYLWNNKLWELKTPEYERAVNKAIRTGIHQIDKNPGGIILDYRGKEINFELLMNYVEYRVKRSSKSDLDIIIILDENDIKILRYKK